MFSKRWAMLVESIKKKQPGRTWWRTQSVFAAVFWRGGLTLIMMFGIFPACECKLAHEQMDEQECNINTKRFWATKVFITKKQNLISAVCVYTHTQSEMLSHFPCI